MELRGRTAVITGGAGGIGRACALALAAAGTDVVVADVDEVRAQEVADEVGDAGGSALAVGCDVTSDVDVHNLRDAAVERFERVDLLVNIAGGGAIGPIEAIPLEEWERLLDLNVVGAVRTTVALLADLEAQGGGHIVNTTSSLALIGGHPAVGLGIPYVTTKAAIIGFSQALAEGLRPRGVGVSVLAPEHTETNFDRTLSVYGMDVAGADGVAAAVAARVPEPLQTPGQVAAALVAGLRAGHFLISTTPQVADKLARQAVGLLDPAAMHAAYA